MKVIIVGLGVQGEKRCRSVGEDFVASVDPINPKADYHQIDDVPLSDFDAAFVCLPDEPKYKVIKYLLSNGRHVLVEKPLWASRKEQLLELEALAQENQVVLYTAYNHRFEPHFVKMRDLIQSGTLGRLYHCRIFYGNGTARLVRNSAWRDQGAGVLLDLSPHLLDLMDFWFAERSEHYQVSLARSFENQSFDHVVLVNPNMTPQLEFEMTLLSWRNDFSCDIFAEKGSAHIRSLCKWGPSQFILRKRILPSGRPIEKMTTLIQADPTWELEYQHFKSLIISKQPLGLEKDIWIYDQLSHLTQSVLKEMNLCLV